MIEYTFAAEIAEEDKPIILNSKIYKQWLEASEKKFNITKVHFASVDFFSKRHEPLFIKLNATAFLPDGKPVHGIVLVRGHAVGVLVANRDSPFLKQLRSKFRRGFSTGRATSARWLFRNSKKKLKSRRRILSLLT